MSKVRTDPLPQRITATKAREIITNLNRVDLTRADYQSLLKQISRLITGIPMMAFSVPEGTVFYRGVCHSHKPEQVDLLGHPPADKVTGFQRCNIPAKPMFYASADSAAIFAEIGANAGDNIYLSKWIVDTEFFAFRIPPNTSEDMRSDPVFSRLETFFETRFSQPVHRVFSDQYKITAAIAEKLSTGAMIWDNGTTDGRLLGGVIYPSVAHSSRSDNIAIQPNVARDCLRLQDVREIKVIEKREDSWVTQWTDFCAGFDQGKIGWTGRGPEWTVNPGGVLTFTAENHEWVARNPDGTIVHPH